jgi:hypothetical protein
VCGGEGGGQGVQRRDERGGDGGQRTGSTTSTDLTEHY